MSIILSIEKETEKIDNTQAIQEITNTMDGIKKKIKEGNIAGEKNKVKWKLEKFN